MAGLTSSGQGREVARMPGLLEPRDFLAMFRYVREKGYEQSPFPDWLKRQA
jgi:thioredoxin-related protein